MIYFDNAATTWPKPEPVYHTMDEFARKYGANPGRAGHKMAVEAEEIILETRHLLARFIGAEGPNQLAFTLNATDALNIGMKGVLRKGDHAITSSIEHNSVIRPLKKLADDGFIELTELPFGPDGFTEPASLKEALRDNTRLIAHTHASNVTGVIQPVQEMGQIARDAGVLFLVDAAQTIGVIPIDVAADKIDMLAFPGHKALFGPPGTGALYVREGVEVDPYREGGTGTGSELSHHPMEMPFRLEGGTPNTVGIAALGAGIKYINEKGLDAIRGHEAELTEQLRAGLTDLGAELYSCSDPERRLSTVSFNLEGMEPSEVGGILDQSFEIACRTGLHCAPSAHRVLGTIDRGGSVRFSMGLFNTADEVNQTLDALKELAL